MIKQREPKQRSETDKLELELWEIFSVYIRLRDTNSQGVGRCFTCGRFIHWTKGDCGHGIPRQYKPTKFNETNNHLQCKPCNGFEGGMREMYKENMNKKYGPYTWEKMLIASRTKIYWSPYILQKHIDHYTEKVEELKKSKGMLT